MSIHRRTGERLAAFLHDSAGPAHLLGGQASLMVIQGVQFVLLARALGPHEFGLLAAVLAITATLVPFCGLGTASVAMMRLARREGSPALYFGNALAVSSITGVIGAAVASGISVLVLPGPHILGVALLLSYSEMLLARFVEAATQVFLGQERHGAATLTWNFHAGLRLLCAVLFWWFAASPTAIDWALIYGASTLLSAALVVLFTARRVGRPQVRWRDAWSDARVGFFFALANSARTVWTDADKAILARATTMSVNGAYTAAFRLMAMSYTPVVTVMAALQPRFFRAGASGGLRGVRASMLATGRVTAGYGALVGLALYAGAPLLPAILGARFADSVGVLQALAGLPLLLALQYTCSEALVAADRQRLVAFGHVGAACASIALNLLLAPMLAWRGCAIAAYAVQAGLVAYLLVAIWRGSHAEMDGLVAPRVGAS